MQQVPAAGGAGRRGSCRSAAAPRSRSPGATSSTSHAENSPPGISRTPIRGARAGRRADRVRAPVLVAVDRRGAGSATGPAAKAKASRRSSGTSKVTATASSVSRSTRGHGQGVEAGAAGPALGWAWRSSDLLHVLERLAAGAAAVAAPCRRWRRTPRSARRRPSRSAGSATARRVGSRSSATGRRGAGPAPGGEMPASASFAPAALGDPVGASTAGDSSTRTRTSAKPASVQPVHAGRRASSAIAGQPE